MHPPVYDSLRSIRDIRNALLSGRASPVEFIEHVLERIEREDRVLRAWVSVDAERALAAARSVDVASGPLAGVPFGVKDVIDVRGLPTRYGVASYNSPPAAFDAWCVAAVRAAGAIPLGKLATTPYAYRDPPAPTRNPWDLGLTPGGSSAGSAASVAARQIPFAFGTQTGGSTLRPAAYNGVVGLITTVGKIATTGVMPLAPTFDRVGILCSSAEDATTLLDIYDPSVGDVQIQPPLRIGYARSEQEGVIDGDVESAIDRALGRLSAAEISEISMPDVLADADAQWETLMAFEAAGLLRDTAANSGGSPLLVDAIARGAAIRYEAYLATQRFRLRARTAFARLFERCEIVAYATAGRPTERSTTGFEQVTLCWPATALGLPAISLPIGLTPDGLPVGLQLIAPWDRDGLLLAAGRWLERAIGFDNPGPKALR